MQTIAISKLTRRLHEYVSCIKPKHSSLQQQQRQKCLLHMTLSHATYFFLPFIMVVILLGSVMIWTGFFSFYARGSWIVRIHFWIKEEINVQIKMDCVKIDHFNEFNFVLCSNGFYWILFITEIYHSKKFHQLFSSLEIISHKYWNTLPSQRLIIFQNGAWEKNSVLLIISVNTYSKYEIKHKQNVFDSTHAARLHFFFIYCRNWCE